MNPLISRTFVLVTGVVLGLSAFPASSFAQTEGDYLYRVTVVRAAPGHFNHLMTAIDENIALTLEAGDAAPFWMRHSQGDHWDFMLMYPMEDHTIYYAPDRVSRRSNAWQSERGRTLSASMDAHTSYSESWFSRSIGLDQMKARFADMGFFHIEMFAGLPGKRAELLEQRRMENRYYAYLNRQQNVIFTKDSGSNWDAMTIGFHESLSSFVSAGNLHSAAEQEEAAVVAGFSGTDDIGPYLRSLLSYHNDTMAVLPR